MAQCSYLIGTRIPHASPLREKSVWTQCRRDAVEGQTYCDEHRLAMDALNAAIARRNAQKLQTYMKGKARAKTDV